MIPPEDAGEPDTGLCLGLAGSTKKVSIRVEAPNAGDIDSPGLSLSPSASNLREREESEDVPEEIRDGNRGNIGGPSKGGKYQFSKEQIAMLEETFKTNPNPSMKQKEELAKKLGVDVSQVRVWFQNRRARTKQKETLEQCQKQLEVVTREKESLEKELEGFRSRDGNPELQQCVRLPSEEEIKILQQQNEQQAQTITDMMSKLENYKSMVAAVSWEYLDELRAMAGIGVPLPTSGTLSSRGKKRAPENLTLWEDQVTKKNAGEAETSKEAMRGNRG